MESALRIQELVELVTEHIHDDLPSLKSASIINRAFYTSCASHMYRSITLRFGSVIEHFDQFNGSSRAILFHRLLIQSPHIAHLVRDLHIIGNFRGNLYEEPQTLGEYTPDAHLPHVLDILSSLSSLKINHVGVALLGSTVRLGTWDALSAQLTNSLATLFRSPSIHYIHLANFIGVPVGLLRSSPGVKRLRLVFSTPRVFSAAKDHGDISPQSQLDSLDLIEDSLTQPPISRFLEPHSPFNVSRLKTFNVFVSSSIQTQQRALWEFLQAIGTNIENLGVRCWQSRTGAIPDPLDFGQLPVLRSLNLACQVINANNHPLYWLNHHFEKFKRPNGVEEITITITLRSDYILLPFIDVSGAAWEAMDSVVYNANLPCLRKFNIHFQEKNIRGNRALSREDGAQLISFVLFRMSHLRSKNILSVKIVLHMPSQLAYFENE